MNYILLYFILNCLFLSYVRLRDRNKLEMLRIYHKIMFVAYLGIFALPLHLVYFIKIKFFKKKNLYTLELE